jgi:hypothetical protein
VRPDESGSTKRDYQKGSGNVFADLGFRSSKQELLKAKLTVVPEAESKFRGGGRAIGTPGPSGSEEHLSPPSFVLGGGN